MKFNVRIGVYIVLSVFNLLAQTIQITSPQPGTTVQVGSPTTISWTSTNVSKISIYYSEEGVLYSLLQVFQNNPGSYVTTFETGYNGEAIYGDTKLYIRVCQSGSFSTVYSTINPPLYLESKTCNNSNGSPSTAQTINVGQFVSNDICELYQDEVDYYKVYLDSTKIYKYILNLTKGPIQYLLAATGTLGDVKEMESGVFPWETTFITEPETSYIAQSNAQFTKEWFGPRSGIGFHNPFYFLVSGNIPLEYSFKIIEVPKPTSILPNQMLNANVLNSNKNEPIFDIRGRSLVKKSGIFPIAYYQKSGKCRISIMNRSGNKH